MLELLSRHHPELVHQMRQSCVTDVKTNMLLIHFKSNTLKVGNLGICLMTFYFSVCFCVVFYKCFKYSV